MTALFAAGNSGVDADADGVIDLGNVIVPATAKNIISVGASENNRPALTRAWGPDERFPADPIARDRRADAPWGLAAFSSRGYTLDGRVKPDIVAPGTYISSTKSVFYTAVAGDYMYAQGTSMAAPLVAGAAALVREFLTRTMQIEPSAALVKAILANGATELYPGQYGPAGSITQEIKLTRPSPQAGWGRVNLEASLFPVDPRRTWYWDTSHDYTSSLNLLSTGQTATYTFELTSSAPVSITLAWTDYPGAPAANGALVNDLDLQVTGPLTTYTPNHPGQRGPTRYLYHDDWVPEAYSTGGAIGAQYAVRFTPSDYPAKLDRALFYIYKNAGGGPITFTAKVYDDDGAGGGPGTPVYTTTALARLRLAGPGYAIWHPVNLSAAPVISAGSFYVALEYTAADDPSLGLDTTAPINQQSWKFDGIAWTQVLTSNMMIHAVVKGADHVTLADRVNNVEGIDIADPIPGVYTLTVSGYHVPFGPQPYALVASGLGRLLGAETFTRAVRAPGRYAFGNTGAKIEVASAGATIGVTVQRNTFPTIFRANSVARTYLITASDISAGQLSLGYEPAEMPEGLAESALGLFRWNGAAWTPYSSVVDVNAHIVTASVPDVSSRWAIAGAGGPAPHTLYLPVVLR
jgi:hypothetical protein